MQVKLCSECLQSLPCPGKTLFWQEEWFEPSRERFESFWTQFVVIPCFRNNCRSLYPKTFVCVRPATRCDTKVEIVLQREIWKFFTKNRLAVCLLETVLKMTKGPKSRFKEMSQVKLCPCSRQALQSKFDAELMSEQARSVPFLRWQVLDPSEKTFVCTAVVPVTEVCLLSEHQAHRIICI